MALADPGFSPTYEAARKQWSLAVQLYQTACIAYRAREIGDAEFLIARRMLDGQRAIAEAADQVEADRMREELREASRRRIAEEQATPPAQGTLL